MGNDVRTANCLCFGGWHYCCVEHWGRHCLNVRDRLSLREDDDTGVTRGPVDKNVRSFDSKSEDIGKGTSWGMTGGRESMTIRGLCKRTWCFSYLQFDREV